MDMKELREKARERMKGYCALCPQCNGNWCAGKVPGMGGAGSGDSFKRAYEELKKYKLIMRTIHGVKEPQLETEFFGERISFPVIGAPITGAKYNMGGYLSEEQYCKYITEGSLKAGTVAMLGDTADLTAYEHGINMIKKVGGKAIPIIKPRENAEIIRKIKIAEEAGAFAVGMDIDGAGLITMKLFGQPVSPKTFEELKELVESTKLPFIVKGIISVEDALMCAEAGVAAIIVSNHGGRVLNQSLAPVEVLEDIVEAVGERVVVIVDGSVREGVDILKYLALGAQAVLLGRPLIWGAIGGAEEGVIEIYRELKNQLIQAMLLTGTADVREVDKKILKKV
ncbi:MAG: alpha-hydroxy-acid oxidizing protein [Fusobacteriaceae bacterium]